MKIAERLPFYTPLKSQRYSVYARRLREQCRAATTLEDVVEAVLSSKKFSLVQKRREILKFVEIVRDLRPRWILDIGSSGGGTVCLFAHAAAPSARIFSLDLHHTVVRQNSFPHLVLTGKQVTCFKGDSHDPCTRAAVQQWLGGERLDLLFIDGDHSYAGVESDYRMYSPLVRPGGVIGFHDIVPDFKTRYGRPTGADVGEVPRFWSGLKQSLPAHRELIENPDQDGFGIGVVTV